MARKKNIFNGEKNQSESTGSRVNMGGDDLDLACTGGSLVDQYCHPDSPIMMAGKAVLRLLYGLTRSKPAPKPGFRHRLNILTMSKATLKAMSKIGVDGAPNRTEKPNRLKTSRERPKSAPYPRLKNSKRTSKFPSIGELGLL